MEVRFYTFSKKSNSTKQPKGQPVAAPDCKLKENTSIMNPSIIITGLDSWTTVNYAYIPDFRRYYFIQNVTAINNTTCQMDLDVDVLASFKSSITAQTFTVERCSKVPEKWTLTDPLIYPTYDWSTTVSSAQNSDWWSDTGSFLVRVTNADGLVNYMMDYASLQELLNYTCNAGNFTDVLQDEAVKSVFNPFKYITAVIWIPLSYAKYSGTVVTTIKMGFWTASGINAKKVAPNDTIDMYFKINPSNPIYDTNAFGYFDSNFSQYWLALPAIGTIPFSMQTLTDNVLDIQYTVDMTTGTALCQIKNGAEIIQSLSCQFGVPYQIGQMGGVTTGIMNTVGSILHGSGAGLFSGFQPDVNTLGSTGSVALLRQYSIPRLYCHARQAQGVNFGSSGYYRHAAMKLSTISGYVQCSDASVYLDAYEPEIERINGYLNSGCYIE